MDDDFELPVLYKGKLLMLPARLHLFGFTYKIEVDVDELKISFEKDDGQNWRALISPEAMQQNKMVNADLLQAIAFAIDNVLQ